MKRLVAIFTVSHGLLPGAVGALVAAARVAHVLGTPAQRLAVAAVVGGVTAVAAGLALRGPAGRATLRAAFARRVAAAPELPEVLPL